ncbi:MAG: HAD family acid phosphatase [Bacteroidota bacterium]
MSARLALLLSALTIAGCASLAPVPEAPPPAETSATAEIPLDIRWVRRSAEHRAVYAQTYRAAGLHLRAVADTLAAPDWAVVIDADETLLDNSLYQRERAEVGLGYTPETWNQWVRREAAPALPGAVAFTDLVRGLGGRVVVVTNRDDIVCDETRRNLSAVGIEADAVLCRVDEGDKNARFAAVEQGTLTGLPPLAVVMWMGDNIGDFPDLSQDVRFEGEGALSEFGSRFWAFPNPMYGSWTRNEAATTD